jgi:hypothetical protein
MSSFVLAYLSQSDKVSFCDHKPSGVRPSVNLYFKRLFLINYRANFIQTSHKCSVGGLLKDCSKNLIPCRTLVVIATERKDLNNILLKTPKLKLKIFDIKLLHLRIYQVCSNKSPGVKIGPARGGCH